MMDLMNGFMAEMKAGPQWVYYWVVFMGMIFFLSIPFAFKSKQARAILVATLIVAPMIMMWLYGQYGFERILGLGHIIPWTPALYYVFKTRKDWLGGQSLTSKWLTLTVIVMCISLVMDVTDVARYLLGERG